MEKSLLNTVKSNDNNYHIIDKKQIGTNMNKNINFNIKRKIAFLPEYSSDMGALSENDVLYYLSELQNIILKFNKTYFGKEYYNINITTNKFILKINRTYLEKLYLTFDVKLVKFSTILTKNIIELLKDIILYQFYKIEKFIHISSR